MVRRSTVWMSAGLIASGMLLGGAAQWHWSGTMAHAETLDVKTTDRLYQELRTVSSPLVTSSDHLAKIAKLCSPSVVHIQSERQGRRGFIEETGSGVIVTSTRFPGHYVVTNRHVVDGTEMQRISIHLQDGRVLTPKKIWTDKASDLAILMIEGDQLQAGKWGDSSRQEIGHIVLAMGSPFGLSQSITMGIISAKGRRTLELGPGTDVLNQDFLQTDAAINPGNSGGPLINLQGEIVGINTAIASSSGGNEGIGFSIPSNMVVQITDQLLEFGKVSRAYLGVKLDPDFNLQTAQRLKLDRLRGSRVMEIYPDTPAFHAGLKFDDVVLFFDGIEVLDENHLINLVSLQPVNKEVNAIVLRSGQKITIKVKLSGRPDNKVSQRQTPGHGSKIDKLGLTLHPLTPTVARELGLDRGTSGLLVLNVDAGSPLNGRVQLYDLIEEVARTPVQSVDDLEDLLQERENVDSLLLKVRRKVRGETESQVVVVGRKS